MLTLGYFRMWLCIMCIIQFYGIISATESNEMEHTTTRDKGTDKNNFDIDFVKKYEIVKLTITKTNKLFHIENVRTLKFNAFGADIAVDLMHDLSYKIRNPHLSVHFQNYSWSGKRLNQLDISLYKGSVRGFLYSTARGIIDGQTFDGYIRYLNITLYIEPYQKYNTAISDSCIVYRQEDLLSTNRTVDTLQKGVPVLKTNFTNALLVKPRTENKKINKMRTKRSTISSQSCTLHVVVDHTFYKTTGKNSVSQTVSEILYMVENADRIFRSTDFDGNGVGDNTGFTIAKITIFASTSNNEYKMSNERLSVYDYLDVFSLYDFEQYCLGVAFTHRDFSDGVIGLAWVGTSNTFGSVGGICQPRVRLYTDNKMYSFNTALISTINYNKNIPSYLSALTLAHEFGHSFGSSHDETSNSDCSPDNDQFGNYIMFPYASDGSKPNHDKFSPCSINSMYPVIIKKGHCLVISEGPVCGNSVVEDGEECDCGNTNTCDFYDDICCTPSDTSSADIPCKYRKSEGKVCSPKHSPCCRKNCTLIPSSQGYKCASSTSCKEESFCNGTHAECPSGITKVDGTICDNGRKACKDGFCIQHICTVHGLEVCQCNILHSQMCMLCCKTIHSSTCLPASHFGILDPVGKVMYSKNGEPCKNFTGICNDFGVCIRRDTESTKTRLMEVFNKENMEDIEIWLKNYWYYLVISLVGIALFTFIFIVTRKKLDNTHVDAFRMGRLMRVIYEANIEKEKLRKNMSEFEIKVNDKIRKLQDGVERMELTAAVTVLHQLFPTASLSVVTKVVKQCTSEDVAVRLLLAKGYPIRQVLSVPIVSREQQQDNMSF